MKVSGKLACLAIASGGLLLVAIEASAEPAPAPPIDAGRYDTPWGSGELRIQGANGILTLADGTVMWGPLSNGGRSWEGRWVRAPRAARADRLHTPCRMPRWNVPSTFAVPSGVYWGEFRAHSLRVNGPRAISISWSNCTEEVSSRSKQLTMTQAAPVQMTHSSTPARLPPIVGRYDGPCYAVSGRALARISPCHLDPVQTFRLTLLKDVQKPVTRIVFTPLADNRASVAAALLGNTSLPLHPTDRREVFQYVRGDKLHLRGSSADIMPPLTICEHDFWTVSVIDGTGQRHRDNGILVMSCGPGRIPRGSFSLSGDARLVELPVREK